MDHLDAVASQVRQRIETFRELPRSIGESNTKASLIEPLLQALEWEVHDPTEVHREYRHRGADNPVDYGLLVDGKPLLLIEAKGLGENISDPRWANQLIGYAAVSGVSWVALTDGDTWQIYNAAVSRPTAEKRFRSVSLSDDLSEAIQTLELLRRGPSVTSGLDDLWAATQVDREVQRAVEELFSSRRRSELVSALAPLADGMSETELAVGLERVQIQVGRLTNSPPPVTTPASPKAPSGARVSKRTGKMSDAEKRITVREMVEAGVLTVGQRLIASYQGATFEAAVTQNGKLQFQGQE